ncbi:MAG: 7-cyano-7-deazaguanine synthase QueC [Xanthomonadaceae bacterium]|nr:7-cyano-7-deazaguanine synthase QueC [Xanthomonadaceae bacterium]
MTEESSAQPDTVAAQNPDRAVILLSGGLDSATTLAIAIRRYRFECHTLALDYGQRHSAELEAARAVSKTLGAASHRTVSVDLRAIGGSALTAEIEIPESNSHDPTQSLKSGGIPVTYVPARNTILLAIALGLAETLDTGHLFIGVNAVDYSGYPDCRPQFIAAFEELARTATRYAVEGGPIRIHTPLIHLTKAEIIATGLDLGLDYANTVSCYQADDEGRACGRCDSCHIRRTGFTDAGVADPTRYIKIPT